MKELKQLLILVSVPLLCTGVLYWIIWGPLRCWLFQLIPAGEWAGLMKIAVILVMSLMGGIWFPIIFGIVIAKLIANFMD